MTGEGGGLLIMFDLFGIKIADLTLSEAIGKIESFVSDGKKHLVVTANPEIVLAAIRNSNYKVALQSASLVVADGAGLIIASYLYNQPIKNGRIVGVDLVEQLIKESNSRGFTIFLAGSSKEVLDKTTHYFTSNYSKIRIVGQYSFLSDSIKSGKNEFNELENNNLINKIKEVQPDILLLAFGHPKQELWLYNNMSQLPIKVGIGVGGAFDFLSGTVKRAPRLFRVIYLEWFWRLIIQPWRIKRIFDALIVFPCVVMIDLIKNMFHVEHNKPE